MYMYALPFFTVATLCTNQRISYLASIRVALKRLFLKIALYYIVQLNDAFCQTHPWLAQKVCTRSAHAAVSKGYMAQYNLAYENSSSNNNC